MRRPTRRTLTPVRSGLSTYKHGQSPEVSGRSTIGRATATPPRWIAAMTHGRANNDCSRPASCSPAAVRSLKMCAVAVAGSLGFCVILKSPPHDCGASRCCMSLPSPNSVDLSAARTRPHPSSRNLRERNRANCGDSASVRLGSGRILLARGRGLRQVAREY